MKMTARLVYTISAVLSFFAAEACLHATDDCYSRMDGDTLTIGNSCIERKFVWNGGNLMTYSINDKISGKVHYSSNPVPDFVMSSSDSPVSEGKFSSEGIPMTPVSPEYHLVTVTYRTGSCNRRHPRKSHSGTSYGNI